MCTCCSAVHCIAIPQAAMSLRYAQAEDAGSGDGDAAAAAAAAAAVAESAAKVLQEQATQALPVREDYFLGDDAAASPDGAGAGRRG